MDLIGRLHPLIVHLPIGILMLAILMEMSIRIAHRKELRQALTFVLAVGALSSVVAVATGLNLANHGDYDASLLSRHQWCAIALSVTSIIAWYQHRKYQSDISVAKLYLPSLCGIGILLSITGHLGGSMTHGADFLTAGTNNADPLSIVDIEQAYAFTDIIQPILHRKCNSCHNPAKAKGDLIMITVEDIEKGGKEGKVLVAGSPAKSNLLVRAYLPIEEKKHMPPKGKKQLTEDELSLLSWWIKEGASYDKQILELSVPDSIKLILDKYKEVKTDRTAINIQAATASQINSLRESGIKVNTMGTGSPWLDVNLSHRHDITSSLLNKLKEVGDQVSELQLANTNVDDQLAGIINKLPNLRKLKLQNTPITDKSINNLKDLSFLESLNLYGTNVTDQSIEDIIGIASLKQLYLWQTDISDDGVELLRSARPLLQIQYKMNAELFGDATLKPPLIAAAADIFSDTMSISFELNFKKVVLRYTLDGSDPDCSSAVYDGPILIDRSALVKVISTKQGWQPSEVNQRQFVKASVRPKSITVSPAPNDKYKGSGAKTLIDFSKGTVQFTNGKWLGYEGEHMSATITLEEATEVSSVIVSALKADASYIHFPRNISVSASNDGSAYSAVGELDIPIAPGPDVPLLKNFLINIRPSVAKYIKVDVKSQLVNPDWHSAPGAPCWLFIDEILLDV